MKIAGVKANKSSKGDPIEYSPEQKFSLAVQDAVKQKNDQNTVWWAEQVSMHNTDWQPQERSVPQSGKANDFQNNYYIGSGEVYVKRHNLATDKLRPSQKGTFKIEFCDCVDEVGMPDLEIKKFELNLEEKR